MVEPVVELGATVPVVDTVVEPVVEPPVETGAVGRWGLGLTLSGGSAATDSTVGTDGALDFTWSRTTLP